MADPNRTVLTESDITDPGPLRTALNNSAGAGAPVAWGDVTGKPSNFPPSAHAASHASDGADPVTPASIGAQPALSGSIPYVNQHGTRTSASYTSQSFPAMFTFTLSDQSIGLENVHSKVDDLLTNSGIQTLTNPTTIPVDGPSRLDLVFTEPTTVTFEQPAAPSEPGVRVPTPGLTDIVLSIEGYEHVTWDGVVVHGTPDQSGVVWASALWRQRNSSWHLLCEQDPAQAGGGGLQTITYPGPTRRLSVELDESGGYARDADGLTVPIEEDIPEVVQQAYQDVVVPVERDRNGVRQRSLQPVRSGLYASVGLNYFKTDSPDSPGTMQDGVALSIGLSVEGPDVRIVGSFWAARNTGLEGGAPVQIGTAGVLLGHAETGEGPITWMSQYDVLADFTLPGGGLFAVYLIAIPDPDESVAGIYMYAARSDDGVAEVPGPVVLPENPDEPSGLWLSHFDFTVNRSGRWRDLP